MKNIWVLVLAVLLSLPAGAAPSFESAQAAAGQAFQSFPRAAAVFQKGLQVPKVPGQPAAERPAAGAAKAVVPVYGSVHLSGTAFVPRVPGYARIELRGNATLTDATGQIRSQFTWITVAGDIYVSGGFVSAWARPNTQVHFYKNGKYAGSAWIRGDVPVNGWVSGNWLNLSGFGQLSGQLIANP
ncbi:MAG: hypothetical protein WC881_11835 [Elusimicrobiota bacterium]